MSNTKAQPNGCRKETSLRRLANSSGFTETQILYAFHITQAMDYYLDSK
jgi:hypothetical protein